MNRLTRKTDGRDYCLYCRQVEFDNEVLERNDTLLYEEPQDYYNRFPYQTSEVGNEEEILNKLGELEDIEEELGISLPILLKAKKVYFKYFIEDEIKESYRVHFDITRNILIVYEYPEDEFGNGFSLKEYGKTWALCEEDLKSE